MYWRWLGIRRNTFGTFLADKELGATMMVFKDLRLRQLRYNQFGRCHVLKDKKPEEHEGYDRLWGIARAKHPVIPEGHPSHLHYTAF